MRIAYDPAKNAKNIAERGLSFDLVATMDWATALAVEDARFDYGEVRLIILAMIGDRLHVAVITPREDVTHVISLRKANKKEIAHYERTQS